MNAVIFDFDGTIADSFEQVLSFLCSQARRDPASFSMQEREQLRGLSMRELAVKVGIPTWRLPLVYFRGKARLAKKMRVVAPFAGINEVLANLHADDYHMFVISSNSRRNINSFLTQHGMSGYFIEVYGNAGWFGKGGVLKRTMAKYNLQPQSTVYVGDEVRDLVGAKVAGMPSVAVSWGFGSEEQLLKYSPTVLVRKPSELQKTLLEWGKQS